MATAPVSPAADAPGHTSLAGKLFDIFVSPTEVFDTVVTGPPRMRDWLVPTLLLCLTGVILACSATDPPIQRAILRFTSTGLVPAEQAEILAHRWRPLAAAVSCASVFAGTFWSAGLLWLMGRYLLKSRFPYLKAVEVVGLAGAILLLGAIVTRLLVAASGNELARPALSLLAPSLAADSRLRAFLDLCNVFHLWTTAVLAVGLSRLSGVCFQESAFWVFGYWFVARVALLILS